MKRREFIAASAALLVSPRRSLAQGTRRRVGFLTTGVLEPTSQKAWLDGLRNHGWIDGRNLIIEYRYAPSQDRLPAFAAELAEGKDPAAEKKAERGAGTFAELADRYLEHWCQKYCVLGWIA